MSERQFTFNEKLASCILCTALLAQKMCEELTIAINVFQTVSGEVGERSGVLLWVFPCTSINNVALHSSLMLEPLKG